MPNIKSARKRMRTSELSRQRNVAVRSRIRSVRRAFMEAADKKDAEACDKIFRLYCSVLDKAAGHGVITRNTAIRRKSRASNRLRAL